MTIRPKMDYYAVLGISPDATLGDIEAAYLRLIDSDIDDERKKDIKEAHSVLSDYDKRARYDYERSSRMSFGIGNTSALVPNGGEAPSPNSVRVIEAEPNEETAKKGRKILLAFGAAALALLIGIGAYFIGRASSKNDLRRTAKDGNVAEETQDLRLVAEPTDIAETIDESEVLETTSNSEPETTEPSRLPEEDTRRSLEDNLNVILPAMEENGIYNPLTSQPYTKEELGAILAFMRGEYVPEDEAEAYNMVNKALDLACALGSSKHIIYAVNYNGGENSFKDYLDEENENYKTVSFVDAMVSSDSKAYPFLKWFEGKYYEMATTTDREKATQIFNEMTQILAELTNTSGVELNGVVYKMSDFEGTQHIAEGNALQFYVFNYQVFRTNKTQDIYEYHNDLLGLNPEENVEEIRIDTLLSNYNVVCAEDIARNVVVDDNGELLIDEGKDASTFAERHQVATINKALRNLWAFKNVSAYAYNSDFGYKLSI